MRQLIFLAVNMVFGTFHLYKTGVTSMSIEASSPHPKYRNWLEQVPHESQKIRLLAATIQDAMEISQELQMDNLTLNGRKC